jgi:DNA-binding MarR family transcriptional regulator
MPTWQPDLSPVTGRISRLHYLLKAVNDRLHADLEISAAMRDILVALAASGPRTVPQIALERAVSRQHIQSVVNELLLAGLAAPQRNPSHRRSALIALTDEGRARLKQLRERETELLAQTAPAVSQADLAATARLFDLLERDLTRRVAEIAVGDR